MRAKTRIGWPCFFAEKGDLLMSKTGKRFWVTRTTRQNIWVRWEHYGMDRRGLSRRYDTKNFRRFGFTYENERL